MYIYIVIIIGILIIIVIIIILKYIYILEGTCVKKERKWRRSPEVPNSGKNLAVKSKSRSTNMSENL